MTTWKILLVLALQMPTTHPQRAALVEELTVRLADAHRAERARRREDDGPCCCRDCA